MKTTISVLASVSCLFLATLFLGGCSTPDSRIAADPAAFASLTPQQQAMVRVGQVGIGFTAQAVKLALGDPDKVTVRDDSAGQTQIWHYIQYQADGVFLYSGYYHRGWRGRRGGWGGWWGGPAYPYYLDYPNRVASDRYTVELRNNIVVAVTREAP